VPDELAGDAREDGSVMKEASLPSEIEEKVQK
jgi:hypothetical protein